MRPGPPNRTAGILYGDPRESPDPAGVAVTANDILSLPYRPCVGIMLVNGSDLVFAGRRIDGPSDAWQMPQGGIDTGETRRDAAFRELREETGIPATAVRIIAEAPDLVSYDLPPEMIPQLWGGRFRGQSQSWFLMRLLGDESVIDIATGNPEFNAWTWLRLDELVERIVPFKRQAYATVVQTFLPHLSRGMPAETETQAK